MMKPQIASTARYALRSERHLGGVGLR